MTPATESLIAEIDRAAKALDALNDARGWALVDPTPTRCEWVAKHRAHAVTELATVRDAAAGMRIDARDDMPIEHAALIVQCGAGSRELDGEMANRLRAWAYEIRERATAEGKSDE